MKLSILVPVFNEEKTVLRVVEKLLALSLPDRWTKQIIIVDDGSTDQTSLCLERQFSHHRDVTLLRHLKNSGKGMAIRTGIASANGNYILIQDADLEYDPADIQKLVALADLYPQAVIYGSRFLVHPEDTVFGHRAANWFLTLITNFLYGSYLTDMETCYKLIPRSVFKRINLTCRRFEFEPEITAKILRLSIPIIEIPIAFKKRGFSQGKKIRFRDGLIAIWTLVRYRLNR